MSKKYKPTDLVFPHVPDPAKPDKVVGMDVRLYLAGQALSGYIATIEVRAPEAFILPEHLDALGQMCARCADAVIAALNSPAPVLPAPVLPPAPVAPPVETAIPPAAMSMTTPPTEEKPTETFPEV